MGSFCRFHARPWWQRVDFCILAAVVESGPFLTSSVFVRPVVFSGVLVALTPNTYFCNKEKKRKKEATGFLLLFPRCSNLRNANRFTSGIFAISFLLFYFTIGIRINAD
uniref:Uncharacterized protein n=1 Tax=Ixodes ricinus TaxID=34613 RepID=A0A6B0UH81_IXORI